jgi:hypothetical protein
MNNLKILDNFIFNGGCLLKKEQGMIDNCIGILFPTFENFIQSIKII